MLDSFISFLSISVSVVLKINLGKCCLTTYIFQFRKIFEDYVVSFEHFLSLKYSHLEVKYMSKSIT